MRIFWRRAPSVVKRKLIFIIPKLKRILEKFYRIYVMHLESSLGKVFDPEVTRGQSAAFDRILKSRSGKQKLQILPALGKLLILAARYDEKDEEGKSEI